MLKWPVYIRSKSDKMTLAIFEDGRHIMIGKSDDKTAITYTLSFGIHSSFENPGVEVYVKRLIKLHKQITKEEFENELSKIDMYFNKFHEGWVDKLIDSDIKDSDMKEIKPSSETEQNRMFNEINQTNLPF